MALLLHRNGCECLGGTSCPSRVLSCLPLLLSRFPALLSTCLRDLASASSSPPAHHPSPSLATSPDLPPPALCLPSSRPFLPPLFIRRRLSSSSLPLPLSPTSPLFPLPLFSFHFRSIHALLSLSHLHVAPPLFRKKLDTSFPADPAMTVRHATRPLIYSSFPSFLPPFHRN